MEFNFASYRKPEMKTFTWSPPPVPILSKPAINIMDLLDVIAQRREIHAKRHAFIARIAAEEERVRAEAVRP